MENQCLNAEFTSILPLSVESVEMCFNDHSSLQVVNLRQRKLQSTIRSNGLRGDACATAQRRTSQEAVCRTAIPQHLNGERAAMPFASCGNLNCCLTTVGRRR